MQLASAASVPARARPQPPEQPLARRNRLQIGGNRSVRRPLYAPWSLSGGEGAAQLFLGGTRWRPRRHPQVPSTTADEVVNTVVEDGADVGVDRFFTIPGRDPFEEVEWELRDAFIPGKDKAVFDQKEVEFPKFWSQTATNIVAQKYFRGKMGSPGARDERQADDRPGRRHDRRLGPRRRLLRRPTRRPTRSRPS